jgi:2-polyprenyl-3-methyl-5-hydroxy-6-metoxy-1,4-benzoquinol methylase
VRELVEGEYAFFDRSTGEPPYFSTQEFHDDREAAPHIEQHGMQRDRLVLAGDFVIDLCVNNPEIKTVTDVCCGDGGLLQYLSPFFDERGIRYYGYEFQPSNISDAVHKRGVDVRYADVANENIELGDLTIMTECLEHFHKPHEMLQKVAKLSPFIVISGPNGEVPEAHYELHTWGWSWPAYEKLIEQAGYQVLRHEESSIFQVMSGKL